MRARATHRSGEVNESLSLLPSPGDYRVFVQVRRAGHVETGVFDAHAD